MKNDGGPAHPETGERGKAVGGEGVSLRDFFAAHAPINLQDAVDIVQVNPNTEENRAMIMAILVLLRYEYADAMLAERAK